jgi:hypothetical protein
VVLVNSRHVKNLPGRKTDVLDCQWLQKLHTHGLLSGSFRPEDKVCVLRSYLRHRENLVRSASAHIQHMQKALTEMNLSLHHVLSDLTGLSALAIIRAILAGERDPWKLTALKDNRVKKSKEEIARCLESIDRVPAGIALPLWFCCFPVPSEANRTLRPRLPSSTTFIPKPIPSAIALKSQLSVER